MNEIRVVSAGGSNRSPSTKTPCAFGRGAWKTLVSAIPLTEGQMCLWGKLASQKLPQWKTISRYLAE
jgi:hypothetical protein